MTDEMGDSGNVETGGGGAGGGEVSKNPAGGETPNVGVEADVAGRAVKDAGSPGVEEADGAEAEDSVEGAPEATKLADAGEPGSAATDDRAVAIPREGDGSPNAGVQEPRAIETNGEGSGRPKESRQLEAEFLKTVFDALTMFVTFGLQLQDVQLGIRIGEILSPPAIERVASLDAAVASLPTVTGEFVSSPSEAGDELGQLQEKRERIARTLERQESEEDPRPYKKPRFEVEEVEGSSDRKPRKPPIPPP